MKKTIILILILAMIVSTNSVAYADIQSDQPIYRGNTVIYSDYAFDNGKKVVLEESQETKVIVTSKKNEDGSYTLYQYNDGVLIESHNTIPGSKVVHSTYYQEGEENLYLTKYTANYGKHEKLSNQIDSRSINSPGNYDRNDFDSALDDDDSRFAYLGMMHHMNGPGGNNYSIECYLFDDDNYGTYVLRAGAADTISGWISTIMSVSMFYFFEAKIAETIFAEMVAWGLLDRAVNGIVTAVVTKEVVGYYNNQEIFGAAYSPGTNYPHGYLTGVYLTLQNGSSTKIVTEGWTTRQWATGPLGNQMMDEVFGLELTPTSWVTA